MQARIGKGVMTMVMRPLDAGITYTAPITDGISHVEARCVHGIHKFRIALVKACKGISSLEGRSGRVKRIQAGQFRRCLLLHVASKKSACLSPQGMSHASDS